MPSGGSNGNPTAGGSGTTHLDPVVKTLFFFAPEGVARWVTFAIRSKTVRSDLAGHWKLVIELETLVRETKDICAITEMNLSRDRKMKGQILNEILNVKKKRSNRGAGNEAGGDGERTR